LALIVLGLLESPVVAARCLNNLAEADFGSKVVSAIAATAEQSRQIAEPSGPLAGTAAEALSSRLSALGVAPSQAVAYQRAVRDGRVLVAVSAADGDEARAAAEMLGDAKATDVEVVGGSKP
jgi:hypothetical protein